MEESIARQNHVDLGSFQKGFACSKCLPAWKKVGAATPEGITGACLNDAQVLKLLSDDDDTDQLHWSIQAANDLAIHAETQGGYDAQWLKATLEKKRVEQPITQTNTIKRQEVLADMHMHGGPFHVMGGMHVTSDDFFVSNEIGKNCEACAARRRRRQNFGSNSK